MEEDVIFEGDQLHQYLTDIGFKEFDVTQRTASPSFLPENKQKSGVKDMALNLPPPSWIWLCGTKWMKTYSSYDFSLLRKHLEVILRSGLLFEEDVNVLQTMIPGGAEDEEEEENCRPAKPVWKSPLFTDVMKYSVGSLSWCCYSIWGAAVLPMTATASVILFSLWDWKKTRQSKQRLHEQKVLSLTLQKLFFILKKSLKYIQENELVLRGFTLARTGSAVSRLENSKLPCMAKRWQSMPGLRKGIVYAILAASSALRRATLDLLTLCPLSGHLDDTGHYLASLDQETLGLPQIDDFDDDEPSVRELKRLHHIYLLLQSEFLRRLGLCFIPCLWKVDSAMPVNSVMKTVHYLADICSVVALNLNREYNVFYSYGISDAAQKKGSLPISEHRQYAYPETFLAIHSAGLHLQAMLLRIRAIEQSLESEIRSESPDITEDLLSKIMGIKDELELCKSCCDECVSQLSKLQNSTQTSVMQPLTDTSVAAPDSNDLFHEPIVVGYTVLDPKVNDEVYEAEIHQEGDCRDMDSEEFDYVKVSKEDREREKQLSERMLQELKSVLVGRAQDWKEREAKVLQSKEDRHETFLMKSGKILKTDTPVKQNLLMEKTLELDSSKTGLFFGSPSSTSKKCNQSSFHNSSDDGGSHNSEMFHSSVASVEGGSGRDLEYNLPPVNFGSLLSLDAVAKFRGNACTSDTETFCSLGDKSSSEESLQDPS